MKYTKHKVDINTIDQFYNDYLKVIKKGEANLEFFYCIFQYQDDPNIYMYSIFDFIDSYILTRTTKKISKFYTYQVLNS